MTQSMKEFVSRRHASERVKSDSGLDLPRITIVTPSYNQSKYLERTILSVINQNYPLLEYFVYDGESTDGSVEIIRKYQDELAHWESVPDNGQSDAIRKGFLRARREVMGWINSDDVYSPDALMTVGKYFKKYPDVDVIYGDTYIIDADDAMKRSVLSVPFSKWGFMTDAFSLHQPSIFWRADLYRRSRGINEELQLAMDRDLWFQFYQQGACFMHIRKVLSCYRVHSETKTSRSRRESLRIRNKIRRDVIGIDSDSIYYRIMKRVMRYHTLLWHIRLGNIRYLMRDAGRRYDRDVTDAEC